MFRVRFLCLLLALCCLVCLGSSAMAAEVDCDATYCFTSQDFSQKDEPLVGICITQLPDENAGTVMLQNRVLQKGDILTADQLSQMTFAPLKTQQDLQAQICYLPIYENRVEKSAAMTLAIKGKEDKAPVAEDSALETYKNLPNEGKLKVKDPEGEKLTYTLVRGPKRGEVELREDGSFIYTPKKNKVGVDSFTYTAADPAGNVSRVATVTVQILKPTDSKQYTDTIGNSCRFEAEWMRNSGLFVGEKVNGQECFYPAKDVSRGQFLAMVVELLDIPSQEVANVDMPEDTPNWLKPYLTAALRSGLTEGWPDTQTGSFQAEAPITGAEAAVMLQNALDLSVTQKTLETAKTAQEDVPAWAESALTVLSENGIRLDAEAAVTRAKAAEILYQVNYLAMNAPGTAVFRMQQ